MVGVERIDLNCGDSDTAATLCQSMTYYSDISSPLIDFSFKQAPCYINEISDIMNAGLVIIKLRKCQE